MRPRSTFTVHLEQCSSKGGRLVAVVCPAKQIVEQPASEQDELRREA